MIKNRNFRAIVAGIATILWLGYMFVGLAVIDAVAPTVRGNGPESFAAFLGLIGGLVVSGLVMWAATD